MYIDKVDIEIWSVVETAAFIGFLVSATLIISLTHRAYKGVFKGNSIKYWWLFAVASLFPLFIVLYFFSLFFDNIVLI